MKRLLLLAAAIAVVTFVSETNVNAQSYTNGYQFGSGLNASGFHFGNRPIRPWPPGIHPGYGFGFGFNNFGRIRTRVRPETQPYFAVNPPVYYSHIVKRPYGISPFPAPAGIPPVELNYAAPEPVSIKNPFVNRDVAPVKVPATEKPATDNKTTWVPNPYLNNVVKR